MAKTHMKKSKKIINYDKKSDVLFIGIEKGVEEEFVEISPGISVELDPKGKVIGVEILDASKLLKQVVKPLQRQILETAAK